MHTHVWTDAVDSARMHAMRYQSRPSYPICTQPLHASWVDWIATVSDMKIAHQEALEIH